MKEDMAIYFRKKQGFELGNDKMANIAQIILIMTKIVPYDFVNPLRGFFDSHF